MHAPLVSRARIQTCKGWINQIVVSRHPGQIRWQPQVATTSHEMPACRVTKKTNYDGSHQFKQVEQAWGGLPASLRRSTTGAGVLVGRGLLTELHLHPERLCGLRCFLTRIRRYLPKRLLLHPPRLSGLRCFLTRFRR